MTVKELIDVLICDSKLAINIKKLQEKYNDEIKAFEERNETLKKLKSLIGLKNKLHNELRSVNAHIFKKIETEGITGEFFEYCKTLGEKIETMIKDLDKTDSID